MPEISPAPIEQPVLDPVTGKFNPIWVRWIKALEEIVRGL